MSEIEIQILQHKTSGLLMAISKDVPGFIVHAHTDEELEEKLVPAYVAFMEATGAPLDDEYQLVNRSTPDFWPPVFVLQSTAHRRAA